MQTKLVNWKSDEIREAVNLYVANLVTCMGKTEALEALEYEISFWKEEETCIKLST